MTLKKLNLSAASILGMAAMVQGCAVTNSPVAAYDGPPLPQEKVATLLAAIGHKNSTYKTLPTQVGERQIGGFLGGGSSVVQVLPGRHRVVVQCYSNLYSATPSITYEFKAGRFYELTCGDIGNGGYAAAGVVDHGTKNPLLTN